MNSPIMIVATKLIAAHAHPISATGRFDLNFTGRSRSRSRGRGRALPLLVTLLLAGCAGLVDKPVRPVLYDFGPGTAVATATATPMATASVPESLQPPLLLAEIEAAGALDGMAVLYRLGYADANQLRPYGQSRWSAPPAQLVRQRLREQLGRDRVLLHPGEGAALTRAAGAMPRVLRIELEEFSHYFESPVLSAGLLRLRATVLESTPAGERLLGQRAIRIERPAPSPDAPGGVRALAAATDAAAEEISQWLRQLR